MPCMSLTPFSASAPPRRSYSDSVKSRQISPSPPAPARRSYSDSVKSRQISPSAPAPPRQSYSDSVKPAPSLHKQGNVSIHVTPQQTGQTPASVPASPTSHWVKPEPNPSHLVPPLPDSTGRTRGLTTQNTSFAWIRFPNSTGEYHLEYVPKDPISAFHNLDADTLDRIRTDQARVIHSLLKSNGYDTQVFHKEGKPVEIRLGTDEQKQFDLRTQKFPDIRATLPEFSQNSKVRSPSSHTSCRCRKADHEHHIAETDLGFFKLDPHKDRYLFVPKSHFDSYKDVPAELLPRFHLGIHNFAAKFLQGAPVEYWLSWSHGTWIREHHLHIKIHFAASVFQSARSNPKLYLGHMDDLPSDIVVQDNTDDEVSSPGPLVADMNTAGKPQEQTSEVSSGLYSLLFVLALLSLL